MVHSGDTEQKEVEETKKIGNVSNAVYYGYMKSGANFVGGMMLLLITICTYGSYSFSDIWLSKWTNTDDLELFIYQSKCQIKISTPSHVPRALAQSKKIIKIHGLNLD